MKNISYYSFDDKRQNALGNCSIALDSAPLVVNCAGNFNSSAPFTTYNSEGRLDYYLLYVVSGTLEVRLPEKAITAKRGDTVVFPPDYKYFYKYRADAEPLSYLWVHFTGSAAEQYLRELGLEVLPAVRTSKSESLAQLNFQRIFEVYSTDSPFRAHALSAILLETLVDLARSWQEKKQEKTLSRSLAYINRNYAESLSVSELARMENLSPSRYHVLFKQCAGMPPSEYIIELRLRHAAELLASTDMSVGQISALVGYDDQHFFSRIFKKHFGRSPSQFRGIRE